MPDTVIEVGSVVRLKSGGCSMVVEEVFSYDQVTLLAHCVWHAKTGEDCWETRRESYSVQSLIKNPEPM